MGASAWFAAVPFDEDVGRALLDAQRQAFADRDFFDQDRIAADPAAAETCLRAQLADPGLPADLDAEDAADLLASIRDELLQKLAALQAFRAATSDDERIVALRAATGFDGTHSVIDLGSANAVRQLTEEEVVRLFGVALPPLDVVRRATAPFDLVLTRFTAVSLTAVDGAGERWTCLMGVSGD